ncbi:MAG: hypothetical protein ACI9MC_003871 [Kiritimatiellia bacterium]
MAPCDEIARAPDDRVQSSPGSAAQHPSRHVVIDNSLLDSRRHSPQCQTTMKTLVGRGTRFTGALVQGGIPSQQDHPAPLRPVSRSTLASRDQAFG